MRKVYLLHLVLERYVVIKFEVKEEECLVFRKKKECEDWLIKRGFVYGQDLMYQFERGNNYWIHQNNKDFIKAYAYINEMKISDIQEETPSWVWKMMHEDFRSLISSNQEKS